MTLRTLLAAVAALPLVLGPGPAHAGALSVSPVLLEMSAQRATRTLEVSNPSDQPVNVQIRIFAWSGGGTDEHYAATQDIGLSPPMFQLAPGARQVVRLAARVTPLKEMSYRLFVDQIPTAPQDGGISMPVRMALPLFLSPGGLTAVSVEWRIEHDAEGVLLVARNAGGRRLRLTNLELEGPGGAQAIERGLAGYVLAGQERAWRLKGLETAGAIRVRAMTDQGDLSAEVRRD